MKNPALSADLARPLKTRRPRLFDGSWRNAKQRARDEDKRAEREARES